MKATIVTIRLQPREVEMLDRVRISKDEGERNRSEILRLLLHREYGRRTNGRSVVAGNAIASDMRNGRPSWNANNKYRNAHAKPSDA